MKKPEPPKVRTLYEWQAYEGQPSFLEDIKLFFKRLFCKEHEYETVTNIHGDPINHTGGMRSMERCIHCGKRKFSPYLNKDCKRTNHFKW